MDIVKGNMGWIEVVCGPMFSGKSEELIRRLRRAEIARQRVQIFKPVIDKRYSDTEIVSHSDLRTEVVGVDEAHFLDMEVVDVAQRLADMGKRVVVAGLETDYLGRPFEQVRDLMTVAEEVTKLLAICVRCGNPAKHTQRLVASEERILVGASGMYEARCRRCFEPAPSEQTPAAEKQKTQA